MYVAYCFVNSTDIDACVPQQTLFKLSYKRCPLSFLQNRDG